MFCCSCFTTKGSHGSHSLCWMAFYDRPKLNLQKRPCLTSRDWFVLEAFARSFGIQPGGLSTMWPIFARGLYSILKRTDAEYIHVAPVVYPSKCASNKNITWRGINNQVDKLLWLGCNLQEKRNTNVNRSKLVFSTEQKVTSSWSCVTLLPKLHTYT